MAEPFLPDHAPVLVQGITGRAGRAHALSMRGYGTNVAGGVSPREDELSGIPVFRNCAEAVAATGAVASVIVVPPLAVLPALEEAIAAGIGTIVTLTEGVPIHDSMRAKALATSAGVRWIGSSTPGIAIPGRMKLGFIPDVSLSAGRLGLISKSGTLSYEVGYRLAQRGLGQSLWVGVGGDPVKGMRFADLLPWFTADENTDALVVVGEIGGDEEEELAAAMMERSFAKPVFALIAGRGAREGVIMGHAGAIIHGSAGTAASKSAALDRAGAAVAGSLAELIDLIAAHPAQ